jgi:hypothetical protein
VDQFGEAAAIGSDATPSNSFYGFWTTMDSENVVVGAYKQSQGRAYIYKRTCRPGDGAPGVS